jgi:hypothetical protein
MVKLIKSVILGLAFCGAVSCNFVTNPASAVANDIDKILKAKDIVRNMVNYPDTLVFHEFYTEVKGNVVTLKFTCKNGFGVPETHVMDIRVD